MGNHIAKLAAVDKDFIVIAFIMFVPQKYMYMWAAKFIQILNLSSILRYTVPTLYLMVSVDTNQTQLGQLHILPKYVYFIET